jgi:hypothetical protein
MSVFKTDCIIVTLRDFFSVKTTYRLWHWHLLTSSAEPILSYSQPSFGRMDAFIYWTLISKVQIPYPSDPDSACFWNDCSLSSSVFSSDVAYVEAQRLVVVCASDECGAITLNETWCSQLRSTWAQLELCDEIVDYLCTHPLLLNYFRVIARLTIQFLKMTNMLILIFHYCVSVYATISNEIKDSQVWV